VQVADAPEIDINLLHISAAHPPFRVDLSVGIEVQLATIEQAVVVVIEPPVLRVQFAVEVVVDVQPTFRSPLEVQATVDR